MYCKFCITNRCILILFNQIMSNTRVVCWFKSIQLWWNEFKTSSTLYTIGYMDPPEHADKRFISNVCTKTKKISKMIFLNFYYETWIIIVCQSTNQLVKIMQDIFYIWCKVKTHINDILINHVWKLIIWWSLNQL